jgi:hypothetical protein
MPDTLTINPLKLTVYFSPRPSRAKARPEEKTIQRMKGFRIAPQRAIRQGQAAA